MRCVALWTLLKKRFEEFQQAPRADPVEDFLETRPLFKRAPRESAASAACPFERLVEDAGKEGEQVFLHPVDVALRPGECGRAHHLEIEFIVLVDAPDGVDDFAPGAEIVAVDEGLRVELPADERVSPVDRDGLGREGIHQDRGRVARLTAFLEGDAEFAVGQEGLLLGDDALKGIAERAARFYGPVFGEAVEEQAPLRRLFLRTVVETTEASFAPDIVGCEVGLVVHLGEGLPVEIVGREAEVPVAQSNVIQPDRVVAEIEIGCDVLPGVEDLHAVVAQVPFPVIRIEQVVRFLAQFDLIVLQEHAVKQALLGLETRLEIHESDFDQFTHGSYVWTSC